MREIFPNVYKIKNQFATQSIAPGVRVYDEKIIKQNSREFRIWNPEKSKLCAAIHNGLKHMPIKPGSNVLYLGAAQGTTASHISDIITTSGLLICIDVATKPFEKLLHVAEERENIIPLLADANNPDDYSEFIEEKVDVVYQDVAQKNQAEILIKNANMHLKKNGYALMAVKARSIDVAKKPEEIFKQEIETLKKAGLIIEEVVNLAPHEKDHVLILAKKVK
ncbi:MAG: fibrillarin-like rRNA/tRNA 2'-O-methyltransferase [DPANN group archaeon]|nr:fibrillarin-like rRNA/tRNA 2'-O-methyltransferase [DPANN group archaeon]